MPTRNLTKSQRRAVRELAGLAHDRELSAELVKLEAAFADWHAGRIDPHELNDRIHAFHQGPSRKLYSRYMDADTVMAVASAIVRGIIADSEVPDQMREIFASHVESFRE